jgi:hypothetical protein
MEQSLVPESAKLFQKTLRFPLNNPVDGRLFKTEGNGEKSDWRWYSVE